MSPRKIFCIFILFLCHAFASYAQSDTPKLRGIQIGYPGIWFYKESKIIHTVYLRQEFGAEFNFDYNSNNLENRYFGFEPVVTLSPRWYYNKNKRLEKGKNTSDNAANYFSLNARAIINPRLLLGTKYVNNFNELSIVPTWGLRRNLNRHFNYELNAGFGYYYSDTYTLSRESKTSFLGYEFQVRVGYKF